MASGGEQTRLSNRRHGKRACGSPAELRELPAPRCAKQSLKLRGAGNRPPTPPPPLFLFYFFFHSSRLSLQQSHRVLFSSASAESSLHPGGVGADELSDVRARRPARVSRFPGFRWIECSFFFCRFFSFASFVRPPLSKLTPPSSRLTLWS